VKRAGFIVLCLVGILAGLLLYLRSGSRPPAEEKLVENFYAHRLAYDHLRDMLLADQQLVRVAKWGLETTKSVVPQEPPDGDFPVGRYQEYLALLQEAGALGASRSEGVHPETICVLVWASGWAGDTRHLQICWADDEPTPQVPSLEEYYRTAKPRHPVFRKIERH
jgi:hypothetical protein